MAVLAAAGYSLGGLWRIVERSIVWQTVRQVIGHSPVAVGVLLTVALFSWKLYGAARRHARSKH